MSKDIIVEDWEKIRGVTMPVKMYTTLELDEKLRDKLGYGPLHDISHFAMYKGGSGSISIFNDEERRLGAFSFSLREPRMCGRSTITSLLYVAKRDENLLKARLIAERTFEGTPRHRDSINYVVEKIAGSFLRGSIYRLGFPGTKLDEFSVGY